MTVTEIHISLNNDINRYQHSLIFFYSSTFIALNILLFPETPAHSGWAETPKANRGGEDKIEDTPSASVSKRRSRWDETPMTAGAMTPSMTPGGMTPGGGTPGNFTPGGATPSGFTPGGITPSGVTPVGNKAMQMSTPTPGTCFWLKISRICFCTF